MSVHFLESFNVITEEIQKNLMGREGQRVTLNLT